MSSGKQSMSWCASKSLIGIYFLQLAQYSVLEPQIYSWFIFSLIAISRLQYLQQTCFSSHLSMCSVIFCLLKDFLQNVQGTSRWNSLLCSSSSSMGMASLHLAHFFTFLRQKGSCKRNLLSGTSVSLIINFLFYQFVQVFINSDIYYITI